MSFGPVGRSERYGVCSDEVRSARGIFRPAHVRAKNDSDFFASADANSARHGIAHLGRKILYFPPECVKLDYYIIIAARPRKEANMDRHTELLKLLEKDCRATPDQLAAMLGRETAEVRSEIAELEKQEVILGYNAMIDWDRTGEELVTALIEVRVTPQRGDGFDRIAQRVYQFEEVESMYLMSGAYDFAVTITGRTLKEVASFVSARLSTIDGVTGTATHFILKKYKEKGIAFETLPVQEERMKYV